MATVLGIRCAEGAVLAGDRRATNGDTVTSNGVQRVFEYDDAAAAVVGDVGAIEEFDRRFEIDLDGDRPDSDPPHIDRIARIASDLTGELGIDGLVVGRDSDGTAAVREIGSDGLVLTSDVSAVGTGASVAFGPLDEADTDRGFEEVESLARETLGVVSQRDPDTGDEIDVLRFENASD